MAIGARKNSLATVLKKGYAPHEQYSATGDQGPWTDIYACGATLYTCLTGEVPVPSLERLVTDNLKPPKEILPHLSDEINSIVIQALNVLPQERPRSVGQFQEMLLGDKRRDLKRAEAPSNSVTYKQSIVCSACSTTNNSSLTFCIRCGASLISNTSNQAKKMKDSRGLESSDKTWIFLGNVCIFALIRYHTLLFMERRQATESQ